MDHPNLDKVDVDGLPENVRNRRGGTGGMLQLVAYGASDLFMGNGGRALCANLRDSMMHWFVERDDGMPLLEDLSGQPAWMMGDNILAHVPADKAPGTAANGSTVPFRVRSDAQSAARVPLRPEAVHQHALAVDGV
jgi:hypothetical protein